MTPCDGSSASLRSITSDSLAAVFGPETSQSSVYEDCMASVDELVLLALHEPRWLTVVTIREKVQRATGRTLADSSLYPVLSALMADALVARRKGPAKLAADELPSSSS